MSDGSASTDMSDVPYVLTEDETTLVVDVLYFAAGVYSACNVAASDFAKSRQFQQLADKIARRNRIIVE